MAVFEPSHPPFWFQSHSPFDYAQHSPPPSPSYDVPLYFMTGPTRTEATHRDRANPLAASANPPRPPNAWILYRSDKLKDLPPPPPGMPRRPQADISKTISSMWKAEAPEVRAQYERLSDIRKAEHQALYPGYRFQPMKKADKDRLRAEKQAERERERGTRKTRTRAPRTAAAAEPPPPPQYTRDARDDASAGPSTAPAHPTPPPEHPTPRATPPRPAPTPTPSPYPAAPTSPAVAPPLAAPQPGVLQRPPSASDWHAPNEHQQQQQQFDALWLEQPLPEVGTFSQVCGGLAWAHSTDADALDGQQYLTVPAPQYPLGWSPDDPSPASDVPFFQHDPLQAVLAPTDDPYQFDLGDFDVNELFDGSREIEITMGANMLPSAFVDMGQYSAFTGSLFAELDAPPPPRDDGGLDALAAYTFDGAFADGDFSLPPAEAGPEPPRRSPTPTPAPYAPPAGALHSSARRVAADWRHIRLTPDSDSSWSR